MKIGDKVEITRRYTAEDLAGFSELTGFAPEVTVPEPLIAALFSYLLGVHLPGPGTNYLKQDLNFIAQAPMGAKVTASVEVTRIREDKHLVDLWARCVSADGTLICEGRSLVRNKDVTP